MPPAPPNWLEKLAGILIPPACREEVVGDLRERYRHPAQYLVDLVAILPFLILSRVRRTTDMQLLLTDALLVYGSFLAAVWVKDRAVLAQERGLLDLAIPAAVTLSYLLLMNALVPPLWRVGLSGLLTLGLFYSGLASSVDAYGFLTGLFLDSAVRALLASGVNRSQSPAGPGFLLDSRAERMEVSRSAKLLLNLAVTIVYVAITAAIVMYIPRAAFLVVGLLAWAVAYRFLKNR